jgi:hypothetical protein
MTKSQAEQLYALFATPQWKAFVEYKISKLDKLHKQLECERDEVNIRRLQGQIEEIRYDFALQKTVMSYLTSEPQNYD